MEFAAVLLVLVGAMGFGVWKALSAPPPRPNPELVCPHCQRKGTVIPSAVVRKQGISGGKATGAVLTGGISVAATGLSRKQPMTHMTCTNCRTEWDVA